MKNTNRFIAAGVLAGLVFTSCLTDKSGDNTPPGIPVVAGLSATYDTLRGVVHLSWNAVNYADFSQYVVYRDSALAVPLSQSPVGVVTPTNFDDTLLSPSRTAIFSSSDTLNRALEYRVKVRNTADQIGLNNGFLPVLAVAPSKVMTSTGLRLLQVAWDSSRQVDSTMVAADLRNVLRGLTEISWALGRSDSIVATRSLSGNALTDTLRLGWPYPGPYMAYIRVRDGAGLYRTDSLRLQGNSSPVIGGSPASTVKTTQEFLFTPTASDPDFDALRFSSANLPSWISLNPVTGQLRGTPATAQAGLYSGILLQVSDGRRTDTLSFDLTVALHPWTIRQSIPVNGPPRDPSGAVELGGSIYVAMLTWGGVGGDSIYSYNPVIETWSSGIEIPGTISTSGGESGLLTMNGEILAFTRNDSTVLNDSVLAYDTASRTWTPRNSAASPGNFASSYASLGGKIYQIREDAVNEYDPLLNVWNPKQTPPFRSRGFDPRSVTAAGGKIYVIGAQTSGASALVFVYDPAQDAWSDGPQIPSPLQSQSLCAAGGNAYVMGGRGTSSFSNRVEMLDTVAGAWISKTPAHTSGYFGPCAEFDGKLYVFGIDISSPSIHIIEEYDPSADN